MDLGTTQYIGNLGEADGLARRRYIHREAYGSWGISGTQGRKYNATNGGHMVNQYKSVTFACPACRWQMTLPQLSSARLGKSCPRCQHEPLDLHQSTIGEKLTASLARVFGRKTLPNPAPRLMRK